ncbi:MAG: hypothetical protein A2268_08355 [Candidatus Raymondbacteria bacterium RifOxyA12_full_50_37]|uniref:Glycosyl transferase family 1 domain-containing protein n=1 Tax=Candidatus Raymondbacteria bacterium RIFOXYD12_FULL_49_13 TaxID=1817890 RepID=A0A1F7F3Z2_UNCRA|nr:MAG: hypothetical protein A2268_08355 [Candidatus Raymondbacteria bacterium RifOxyA12_full_50_37]OGJ90345.1 MAG: hypothetical protein A2248_17290 [Candidatus Raymondbacteria bacterium RIFOXYA2_FULL_49_16]OGK01318.1 MAG: hypothetical protein A2519_13030 [Candidatus Raymondbacteria bacterium RIFOXYD12_FULL_49_13]OGP43244.1 MAG: hypothetical protein A2324_08120 [Candidatus Raymondbacteria bacterium RIFOXYB2_FULL_49_35]
MRKVGVVSRRFLPAEGGVERFCASLMLSLRNETAVVAATQIAGNHPDFPGVDDLFACSFDDYEFNTIQIKALSPGFFDRIRLLPCVLRLVPGLRRLFGASLHNLAARSFAWVYFSRLRAYFTGVTLVHSFAFDGAGLLAQAVARSLNAMFVITPFMHPEKWGDSRQNIRLYNEADAVVALHTRDAENLQAAGVRPDLIRIIGIGIDPFTGDGQRFRKKYAIIGPMVLFVGRLMHHKGYRELVRAVAALRERGREISLVIIGPRTRESDKEFFPEYEGVVYLGLVSEQEKYDAYAACDLFCLPSRSEIMPVSILEAWHAGKPVLAGDIPDLRALVDEGETGMFTLQESDACARKLDNFLSHRREWERMGANGRRLVEERHLMSRVADQTVSLYKELGL